MHELQDREFESLSEGMEASFRVKMVLADVLDFARLAMDEAPVHIDPAVAHTMNYAAPIVHGFLVFGRFSGLLGMVLPGPRTVIHAANYKMSKPVYVGDELLYTVKIQKIVKAVKTVVLALSVTNDSGAMVLKGEAQCGFLL